MHEGKPSDTSPSGRTCKAPNNQLPVRVLMMHMHLCMAQIPSLTRVPPTHPPAPPIRRPGYSTDGTDKGDLPMAPNDLGEYIVP